MSKKLEISDWENYFTNNPESEYGILRFSLLNCKEYSDRYNKYVKECRSITIVTHKILINCLDRLFHSYVEIHSSSDIHSAVPKTPVPDRELAAHYMYNLLLNSGRCLVLEDTTYWVTVTYNQEHEQNNFSMFSNFLVSSQQFSDGTNDELLKLEEKVLEYTEEIRLVRLNTQMKMEGFE